MCSSGTITIEEETMFGISGTVIIVFAVLLLTAWFFGSRRKPAPPPECGGWGTFFNSIRQGVRIMYVRKDDHPDERYAVVPDIRDSENQQVDPATLGVTYEVISDNPEVVSVLGDPGVAGGITGWFHYGKPGIANVNVLISYNGRLVGSYAASFTVTAGDPASIVGGTIELTPAPDVPVVTPAPDAPVSDASNGTGEGTPAS